MKTRVLGLALFLTLAFTTACTQNEQVLRWGGTQTVNLEPGQRLENISWRIQDNRPSLWILTRERRAGEQPETHVFQEHSALGLVQGRVVIQER